jgi:hypothetical protein
VRVQPIERLTEQEAVLTDALIVPNEPEQTRTNMTVQDTIDGLHVSYPQVSDAQALIYFRQVHREILNAAQIENGEEDVALTAGQREYAIETTTVRAAYHYRSAADVKKLAPTSTDWLDANAPTWRADNEQGEPTHFYTEDGKIGLHPVPNETTATYPKVTVYGTTYSALVPEDPIPVAVPTIRLYVEGMKRLYASDRDPSRFPQWDDAYRRELHAALAHINANIEDLQAPRLTPAWMRNTRIE